MESVLAREERRNPLVAVIGPTASGKSELAVELALAFDGEVVSADSRQLYRGLDVGTAKTAAEERNGIPHHLLDIAEPEEIVTVAEYRQLALRAIEDIHARGKVPFLAGGSPFYVYTLTDGLQFPHVAPDEKLREDLDALPTEVLLERLASLDPKRAESIEQKNRRRLIRALEIVLKTGRPVPSLSGTPPPYRALFLGIARSSEELRARIRQRIEGWLREGGIISETEALVRRGLSEERIREFGFEYRLVLEHVQKKLPFAELQERMQRESEQFVRRQMSWFKKDERIHWVETPSEAEELVRAFLAT